MRTTHRGSGQYKLNLLHTLIAKFGNAAFTYREVSNLPEFTKKGFTRLDVDGWLVQERGRKYDSPLSYRISPSVLGQYAPSVGSAASSPPPSPS